MQRGSSGSKAPDIKTIESIELPSVGTQLIYCEHMIGIAMGPFVSKVLIGIDNSPNPPIPQYTLVMPTNALHQMAKNIVNALSDEANQKKLSESIKSYQDSVRS
jgi:hypothetical protein